MVFAFHEPYSSYLQKTCFNGFGPYRDMKIMTRPVNQSGKRVLFSPSIHSHHVRLMG
jgi:hypothetical protein